MDVNLEFSFATPTGRVEAPRSLRDFISDAPFEKHVVDRERESTKRHLGMTPVEAFLVAIAARLLYDVVKRVVIWWRGRSSPRLGVLTFVVSDVGGADRYRVSFSEDAEAPGRIVITTTDLTNNDTQVNYVESESDHVLRELARRIGEK